MAKSKTKTKAAGGGRKVKLPTRKPTSIVRQRKKKSGRDA